MGTNGISFKGTANGLFIVMNEEDDFDTILNHIEKKIETAGKFFMGASISVKYRGKKLTQEEEVRVVRLLEEKSGAEIKSLELDTEESMQEQAPSPQTQNKLKMRNYFFSGIHEGNTKFYRGTVRSGQLIDFNGNLVIIGDVNPGGELIAAGNVVVLGTLRGIVHAGANGNREAIISAFNLQPTQLRIADVITRSPDESEAKNSTAPEIAYIKDDAVYIERYLQQRS